jgi:hypothetical protein
MSGAEVTGMRPSPGFATGLPVYGEHFEVFLTTTQLAIARRTP